MRNDKAKKKPLAKNDEAHGSKQPAHRHLPPDAAVPGNNISFPATDAKIDISGSRKIQVRVIALNTYLAVRAGCFPIGSAPASTDAGVVLLTRVGRTFSSDSLAPAAIGVDTNGNNNIIAAWAYTDIAGTTNETPIDPKEFRAFVPASETVNIDARKCLWFTWAASVNNQNGIPETGAVFKPDPIAIPDGATRVTVSTDASMWASGSNFSNSFGKTDDQVGLENPLYQHADLNSTRIQLQTDFNRYGLVGMLGGASFDNTRDYVIQFLGDDQDMTTPTLFLDIDPAADRTLFLGFHEGADWTNNSLSVNVTLEWTIPARPTRPRHDGDSTSY